MYKRQGDFHCDGRRLGELKNRVSLASIVHLGLGIGGKFCGELLLSQGGGGGRRRTRVGRRRGPAASFGVGAQLGFVSGQQVANAQQIIPATTAGVGPVAFLGFRRGQQVGRQLRRSHRRQRYIYPILQIVPFFGVEFSVVWLKLL